MLLAIDIGNTRIALGAFKGRRLVWRYAMPTKAKDYSDYLRKICLKEKIDDAVICSVVPSATKSLALDLKRIMGKHPLIIGKDIKVPIKNLYRKPGQVGQDRLVNAYAGIKLYGAPLVTVDFGTAVTFDIVSRKKEYLGGMILPGLQVSLDALGERAALLPRIKLERPAEFIGRDTKNSMLSGVVFGFAAMTDDLVARIRQKIGKKARVVATGGNAKLLSRYCRSVKKVNPDLTLTGLMLVYEQARKNLIVDCNHKCK